MQLLSNLVIVASLLSLSEAATIARRASPGCGIPQNFNGQTKTFTINSSGGTRTYRIHLPSKYDPTKASPLMIAYHGSGGTPKKHEELTRFSDETVNPNMIVVYPAGVDGNWQGPSYATEGVSDKVFTTDLVTSIKNNYCIDVDRVYASGQSNGGGFVNTLACSVGHGGQFAAFAPVSGAYYTDVSGDADCNPARSPLPIMETHGGADTTIPYDGGEGRGGPIPAIPEWLSRWAARDQCTSSVTKDLPQGVHHTVWTCAGVSGVLQHYKIDDGKHAWPAQDSAIDISPLIIQFLSSQKRPS